MPKTANLYTPGQRVYRELVKSVENEQQARDVLVPDGAPRNAPARSIRKRFEGLSRHHRAKFAADLLELRERLGLTQAQLADRAGVEHATVAQIEQGELVPALDTAAQLCYSLDVAGGLVVIPARDNS